MRRVVLAALVSVLAACATTPPPPPPIRAAPAGPSAEDLARVEELRVEAKALLRAQAEILWKAWVDGTAADVAATYAGHEALFSPDAIAVVERVRRLVASEEERRALGFLKAYLAAEHVAMAVAEVQDRAASLESTATVIVDGEERAFRELDGLLAVEPDRERRGRIHDSAVPVLRQLNQVLLEKQELGERAVREAGYDGYVALAAELRQADLGALAQVAKAVLEQTEAPYRDAFGEAVRRELGIPLSRLRRADIPRLFRGVGFDKRFRREQALPALEKTLAGLGIELRTQANVTLHDEPLPRKNPRAVCFPIDVPGDVRLSIKPIGGVSDWSALFHEAGHAEHYAHVVHPSFEFGQLGSNAATEAYAFLLEGLTEDPVWLQENTALTKNELSAYLASAAAKKLYMVRRYAAKLLFELAWHRGELGDREPKQVYRALMEEAYLFPVSEEDAERWLVDHDDFFYSADYFRAWFLAAMLEDHLREKHGRRWWASRGAGEELRALWATGNRDSADELANALGAAGVRVEPLTRRLASNLGGGTRGIAEPAAGGARP